MVRHQVLWWVSLFLCVCVCLLSVCFYPPYLAALAAAGLYPPAAGLYPPAPRPAPPGPTPPGPTPPGPTPPGPTPPRPAVEGDKWVLYQYLARIAYNWLILVDVNSTSHHIVNCDTQWLSSSSTPRLVVWWSLAWRDTETLTITSSSYVSSYCGHRTNRYYYIIDYLTIDYNIIHSQTIVYYSIDTTP